MKKTLLFLVLVIVGLASKATIRPVTTSTFVDVYTNQALDGDTLLLDAGTYSTAVNFPTGKAITLKADPLAASQPVLNFQLGAPTGSGGSLIFDGLLIDRGTADYFFSNATTQSMNTWKFVNCTIKNIKKALFNTSNKTGNINNFIIDKCTITACGTSQTSFILISQTVDVFNVTNSTIYNYVGGDFFKPNNATTTKNISVSFINNTMYKCIWNNGYGWVSVNYVYPAGNTYLFKNNIFDTGANTDPAANKPLFVYRGNGTVTEQNNIKIGYQGNNNTTTVDNNLTLGSGVLAAYTSIPYTDAAAGDFSLASSTPFATAGDGNIAVGNPFLIKFIGQSATITTVASPAGAGTLSPTSLQVNQGDSVTLSATRNFGYQFKHWQDQAGNIVSTASTFKMKLNADITLTAVFDVVTTYSLTTAVSGSQWGSVSLTPSPTNGKYEAGTIVSVTAVTNPILSFLNWSDNDTNKSRIVTMDSDKSLTAVFDEVPFIVGWDFKAQSPNSERQADYYSSTSNVGLFSMKNSDGSSASWLARTGSFSPSYPCVQMWNAAASFSTPRSYNASFSTVGFKNIRVNSMVSGSYHVYSIVTLQYSLDGTNYTELSRADITTAYNSAWKDLNVTLPADAEGKTKIYLRWIADTSSPALGNAVDVDGTAITNVFVFADQEVVNDVTAPTLISSNPADGSNTATSNGSIVLTFDEKMKAGTGSITLGSKTLTGVYGSKTVTFTYDKLSYDTQYTFTVPAGALTDISGNSYAGVVITFRTAKRTLPTKKLFDAVVAKDGSGDYTSVIDALAAAPSGRTQPWLIFIKNGSYKGHHVIPSTKPFIHLIGQNRDGVLIKDSLNADNGSISDRSTMVVQSTDCYFENFTIENSYGFVQQTGPMAEALNTDKDRFAMKNVYIRSYQDTWMTGGSVSRQYVLNSRIEGAVDFIYGSGEIFFDRDTLTVTKAGSYIVAPSHGTSTVWGYVFRDNVINQNTDKVTGNINSLFGRPWQNVPKAVFINSKLLTGISPEGWAAWYTAPAIFADYGTMDANGNLVDLSSRRSVYTSNGNNVTVKNSLTDQEAATYTYENVMLRTGDTWDPRIIAEAPEQPTGVVATNGSLSWTDVPYARLYVIFRNNKVIGFSAANAFSDPTYVNGNSYSYAVQSVGEYGALSSTTLASTVLPVTGIELKATANSGSVALTWLTKTEQNTSHFDIERGSNGSFHAIGQVKANGNSQNTSRYSFNDKNLLTESVYYRIKAVDVNGHFSYSNVEFVKALTSDALLVYPTITNGVLNVAHPIASNSSSLNVYNLNGAKMISLKPESNTTTSAIDAGSLASGIYIIHYFDGTTLLKSKFIRQ